MEPLNTKEAVAALEAVPGLEQTPAEKERALFEKAKALTELVARLGVPDGNGHAGIKALIDLKESNLDKGMLRYALRADEATRNILLAADKNIELKRAVEFGEEVSAIDRSHPFEIKIGYRNDPSALKGALLNTTNYNIAVEPALSAAMREIVPKESPAQVQPDHIVNNVQRASQKIAEREGVIAEAQASARLT